MTSRYARRIINSMIREFYMSATWNELADILITGKWGYKEKFLDREGDNYVESMKAVEEAIAFMESQPKYVIAHPIPRTFMERLEDSFQAFMAEFCKPVNARY